MLYRLSYASPLERETGIEPATNSLEGCDSTTELLPQPFSTLPQGRGTAVALRYLAWNPTVVTTTPNSRRSEGVGGMVLSTEKSTRAESPPSALAGTSRL
jgi:hypothetical protein